MTPASRRSIRRVSLVAAIVGIGVASSGTATAQEPETGVVEGRVTNADTGEPVPDQTISLNSGGILALADTAADGSYRLEDIALGPATLATPSNQPAWEDFSTEIDVVAGTQTIDIALTPRPVGVVEGRVTNADTGEPVPDQTISLNSGGILALADTDADGSYRLEDIALGPATLATPSNQPAWEDFSTEIDVVAGTQTIDIALTPRGSSAPTSTAPPTTLVTSPSLADQLPETGESSTSLIAVSIALLAGGWVLLAVSRRGAGFRPDRSGERARSAA